jgi:putative transposase
VPDWRQWEVASENEWAVARAREAVIRPLAEGGAVTSNDIGQAMRKLGVSRALVYRLIQRYRRRPQTSSLLPFKRGLGTNSRLLNKAVEDLIAKSIREFYLKLERPTMAAVFQEVKGRCDQIGLRAPNYRTVRRRVAELDPALVLRRRQGAKAAQEKFGPVLASTLRAAYPMDVLQIDHTLADVILVDQEHRLPIGRPWLSLAIDVASRTVPGFHVGIDPPSALAVSLVLTHAVLPKTQWLADRELDTLEWPTAGIPERVHLDNAKEFHSEALLRGCQEHGMEIEHRPPLEPHFGGHIERLIGTMMGAVHLLPGTTFSNPQEKASYDSEGAAVLTLPELERWLALQIAGVYHLTPHSALGKTPLEAWKEGVAARKSPLRFPADATEFFLDFLPAVPRLIQKDGIHFHGIRYWSSVLSPWAGRLREPLLVKYDPRNIGRVYVRDPSGRHWQIPYADLGQPPIALWELLDARRRLLEGQNREVSERATFANILEQRRIVQEATRNSRERRRHERTRAAAQPDPASTKETPKPEGELKPFPVRLWEDD